MNGLSIEILFFIGTALFMAGGAYVAVRKGLTVRTKNRDELEPLAQALGAKMGITVPNAGNAVINYLSALVPGFEFKEGDVQYRVILTHQEESHRRVLSLSTETSNYPDDFRVSLGRPGKTFNFLDKINTRAVSTGDPIFDAEVRLGRGQANAEQLVQALSLSSKARHALLALKELGFNHVTLGVKGQERFIPRRLSALIERVTPDAYVPEKIRRAAQALSEFLRALPRQTVH